MANNLNKIAMQPITKVEIINQLSEEDLNNLCAATELAIQDGIGFNCISPPDREILERYWRGVMMIDERILIGAWLDGILCGAIQLVKPSKSKETSYFCANIEAHFVAPWARGYHLASNLLNFAEREASKAGYSVIRLSVRETQERALQLYRDHEYIEWGTLPCYEFVTGKIMAGHFFYKNINPPSAIE